MSGSMAGSVDDSAAAGDSTAKEQLVDNPLAKRAKVTAAAVAGDQDVDLLAAAEAGLLPRIKIARQNSSSSKQQATDKQTATTLQPKQQVKRSSSSKRTSKASSSTRAVRLVPKPADPSELVPPPTADEIRRNNSRKTRFTVREILAHRVSCEEDQESAAQRCIVSFD